MQQSATLNYKYKNNVFLENNKKTQLAPDFGLRFLFFFIIYLIIMIKAVSWQSLDDHLFFSFYSLMITVYIFSRFILSYFHRKEHVNTNYVPTISFVVPAKNEGDNIAETLRCFYRSNYPKDKMEVIAINDGSSDNTLDQMLLVQKEFGDKINRFEVVDWKKNRGKREGMAEGVKMSKGEIVIFVDSDSFIEENCIWHLIKYFTDPQVGAVSGHTDVYNSQENILTRMQAVRYYISFKIYKSAESVFGLVTCCPGCCSAYRREYLNEFIDEWLGQTFFGKKCTFGDDRSLTNHMLRKYRTVYSGEALAKTVVPNTFKKYLKQQQRWKKSWVRETIIASSFIWKKNILSAIFFYIYVFLALVAPIVFFRAVLWHPIVYETVPLVYLAGLFLMLFLHGIYYRLEVGDKNWFTAVVSFWFTTVILIWQLPWAAVTMNDTRWGTR
jgi:hyaluronan synthase